MHCMIAVEDPERRLFVIFVLGSVLQDTGEFGVVEVALLVNGCFPEELVHFLICEAVSHGGQQFSQVVLVNDTWSRREESTRCVILCERQRQLEHRHFIH